MTSLEPHSLYPEGIDYAWLATDKDSHVAVFTSAGEGPIPLSVLSCRDTVDGAERLVHTLPTRGKATMLVKLPRPDDFIAFGERGFYAYDWQDCHRQTPREFGYELVCRPHQTITIDDISDSLSGLLKLVQFATIQFGTELVIRPDDYIESYSTRITNS